MLPAIVFLTILTCVSSEYKTLTYNGFNYTYAGEEVADYNGTREWCHSLGGHLPSLHSDADSRFLADLLVGRHREHESIFLGANKSSGSWQWDDGTEIANDFPRVNVALCGTGPCCGLIMWTDADITYHKDIWATDVCTDRLRRKVCKLPSGSAVVDHSQKPMSTTPSPFITLSANLAAARLSQQHRQLQDTLGNLMEKVELLSESMPNELEAKLVETSHEQFYSLRKQMSFLTVFVFLVTLSFVLFKLAGLIYRIHNKKASGGSVSLTDLLTE